METSRDGGLVADLVRKAQAGDRRAFESLIVRYRSRLELLIHLRLGPKLRGKVEVDDVYQEAWLEAFQSLAGYEHRQDSLYPWLGGITEHVIQRLHRHHFQTEKRQADREVRLSVTPAPGDGSGESLKDVLAASGSSPSNALMRSERFERVENALTRLSDDHREVIILVRIRCLSCKEAGEILNRSPSAISMLLLRAIRSLRDDLGGSGGSFFPRHGPEKPSAGPPAAAPEPTDGES